MNTIVLKILHFGMSQLLPLLDSIVPEDFRNGKEYSFKSLKELNKFISTFSIPGEHAYIFDKCTIDTSYFIDSDEENTIVFYIDIDYAN